MVKAEGIRKMSRTDVSDPTVKITIEFTAPPVVSIEKLEEIKLSGEVPPFIKNEVEDILSSSNKEAALQTLAENQLNIAFSDIADDIANYIATSFSLRGEDFAVAMFTLQSFMDSNLKRILLSGLKKQLTMESMR